ncbi:MAG: tRNA preQ1(34) S-adenosylmethionine ribosyltransferase-isomerase QueA [Candidatus Midichloria sp.]|nr:tRNA preQ1(34) S-adenosylmethionine ribosyltransferase-isomerase QueA [Candidatus Midichloria sp.]
MNIDEFDFVLPKELIAQFPANPRGSSKLLYFDPHQKIHDQVFDYIINILNPGDVLVFNDTKVIPSLLKIHSINAKKNNASLNIVHQINDSSWQVMAKPVNKLELGSIIFFDEEGSLVAKVIEKDAKTNRIVIEFLGPTEDIFSKILKLGAMPLPPYIKRENAHSNDFDSYQTVYSKRYGAFAAPTAGLHFTQNLLEKIAQKGVNIQFLTLHVGLGTFAPIKTQNIEEHKMHTENFILNQSVCEAVNYAKQNGNKVICVGTTTMRVLESVAVNNVVTPQIGETDIFIKPGHKFQIADALITNFHLPKSTLLVLVSAFIGNTNVDKVYQYAIEQKYRFFSYGDACYFSKPT